MFTVCPRKHVFGRDFYQQTGDTEKDILTEALPPISFKGNADIEPKETKPAIDPVSERQRVLCKKPDCGSKEGNGGRIVLEMSFVQERKVSNQRVAA